jgi:O-antigen ligase
LYFALLIIGVVALVHGRIRSMLAVLLLMGGLGIAFLQVMGPRHIPLIMKRSLSTVVAMDTDATKAWSESYRTSGEQGWESGFRATLYELAWSRIRVHPLVGNGFRFTNEELAASLVAQGQDRMVVGLALSGGFHNSFVSLAVACGLPAMFLLVAGLGLGLLRMFRDVSRIGTPANRTWVAVLLGYTLSWVGQALMNGAGRDLMIVCMLVPIVRSGVRASLPESVARVPEAGHDRVGIATEGSPV